MKTYDKASRPVYEAAKPVLVHIGITLTQVLDMVIKIIVPQTYVSMPKMHEASNL